jgi:hypothetical protein
LIYFFDKDGLIIPALPFEADDRYYMVRLTKAQAQAIMEDDEDFD